METPRHWTGGALAVVTMIFALLIPITGPGMGVLALASFIGSCVMLHTDPTTPKDER